MIMNYIDVLIEAGLDFETPIKGVNELDLDEMCQAQNVTHLPQAYKEFMTQCGKGAGLYSRDADFIYPRVCNLKNELLQELADEVIELPDNAFVFAAYQGYQYKYFLCDENEDPAVYLLMFTDDETVPTLVSDSLTQSILNGINQYKNAFYQQLAAVKDSV